jgi:hypothetical protein
MELNDYISKAKQDFPNGFSDYIKEHGDKTEWWFQFYKRNNLVEQINGYTFDYSEMAMMSHWDNEKWWTFMGNVDYDFDKEYNK